MLLHIYFLYCLVLSKTQKDSKSYLKMPLKVCLRKKKKGISFRACLIWSAGVARPVGQPHASQDLVQSRHMLMFDLL